MPTLRSILWSKTFLKTYVNSISKLSQPATWSVHRSLYISCSYFKKRNAAEETTLPRAYQALKSKFKERPVVEIWKNMTISDLANAFGKDVDSVLKVISTYIDDTSNYKKGHHVLNDIKVIENVLKKIGMRFKVIAEPNLAEEIADFQDVVRRNPTEYTDVRPRPPVVTIMGHVDHGKTTLLDTLRNSSIVASEFGGITQHIGAFSILINNKDRVTFLDTPGHAAFCSMRNRGAQCTDLVVLVVAADDGVMEQTIESIKMAKQANVPIIVAINKIDKPGADVERTKKMLLQQGVQVEDFGGDVQVVPISALKGTNVNTLIDAILLQAEIMGLQSDYSGPVEGVVIESTTDTYRGKLCTLLVQCGTLKKSAILVAGDSWCKVRSMFNDTGDPIQSAPPASPVQILGWRELPNAGDEVIQVPSEKKATAVVEWRKKQKNFEKSKEDQKVIDEKMKEYYQKYREQLVAKRKLGLYKTRPTGPRQKEIIETDEGPRLNVIIKGDVDGSIEAILDVLETYNNPNCKLDIVHYGVGQVTKNDVVLAKTFKAIIYTFNTDILQDAKEEMKKEEVSIRTHNIIYKLVDDLKDEMSKLLPPLDEEEVLGEANVLQEFLINEGKQKIPVAGSRCIKGKLKKSALFKVIRSGETIFDGKLTSLKHFKDEVDSIKKDMECGLRISDTSIKFRPGDTIVCYQIKKVPQTIKWNPGF